MLMQRLPRPLWHSTVLFSTASDLVRLQRCSRWCYQALHDPADTDYLLRHYFNLTKQQLAELNPSPSLALQRLLLPLASLERQFHNQPPPPLHTALLTTALITTALTIHGLSTPHPPPPPATPPPHTASWLQPPHPWHAIDCCDLPPDPFELTLECVGLGRLALWWHAPFWRRGGGWAEWLVDCGLNGAERHRLQAGERDAICAKLDARIGWIGCAQPDPTTILAIGYYHGHITHHTHHIPDTASQPGYDLQFAYSSTAEADCQKRMALGWSAGLPVVTFELAGSMETVNGHQFLRLYESMEVLLLRLAEKEGRHVRRQVELFVHRVEGRRGVGIDEEEEDGGVDGSREKYVTKEQLRGLPLYLGCFPMPASILCSDECRLRYVCS